MSETHIGNSSLRNNGEVDLQEFFRVVWAGKWLVGAITACISLVAVVVTLMLPDVYRAEALIAANDREGAGGLSALAAQYGGLASLAGINLGSGTTDKTALGLEVLKSRKFITEFIERHSILVPLMAADDWDPGSSELIINSNDYDAETASWVRDVGFPRKTIPSLQEAYDTFMESFSVSQNKKTGFITISIEHYSPYIAKQWVDWLVEDVNTTIMKKDVDQAQQAILYLKQQIQNTSLADLQNVFFRLIEEQTKTVMLAEVSSEYMFRTLDPAIVPEQRAKPKRILLIVLGAIFGGLIGVFVVWIRNRTKTH